jgi:Coenzyme PQQ synthesis protein D (PqqD)
MDASRKILRLRSGVLEWREVEGEVVAFDARTNNYLGANRTAAFMWPALAEGVTHDGLVKKLVERFDITPSRAAADLDAFLDSLRDQDLLEEG